MSAYCRIQAVVYTSSLVTVVCTGLGACVVAVGLKGVIVGTTGTGSAVVVGTGAGSGTVGIGGGPTIEVGSPTGPEQTLSMSQHPKMPLLARKQ